MRPEGDHGEEFGKKRMLEERATRVGVSNFSGRPKMFAYDRDAGLLGSQSLSLDTSLAAVMPRAQAIRLMKQIHAMFHVHKSGEGFLYAFDTALMLCQALNGSSQLSPVDRITFSVTDKAGVVSEYSYHDVVSMLGTAVRRFWRAWATEIVAECKALYEGDHLDDPTRFELRLQMIRIANVRGCKRHPYLISDVSDHAVGLTSEETSVAAASAAFVISSGANAVDNQTYKRAVTRDDHYDGRPVSD